MERIDSYMSNTYLGKMRAAGQIQKAPISRTFFEKNKRKKKKKKKGAKTRAKSDWNLTQLKFLIGKKNSSGFDAGLGIRCPVWPRLRFQNRLPRPAPSNFPVAPPRPGNSPRFGPIIPQLSKTTLYTFFMTIK